MNNLVQEMLRRADLMDLYALADPERCRQYIIVGAKSLDTLFVKINLQPQKGKDGLLYFQKLEGIRRSHPNPEEQKRLCLELAFFFTRIFQIFAALTLSVYDAQLPNMDPADLAPAQPATEVTPAFLQPTAIRGFEPPAKKFSLFRGGDMAGGALAGSFLLRKEEYPAYSILNRYLTAPRDSSEPLYFAGQPMYIPQEDLYTVEGQIRTPRGQRDLKPNVIYTKTQTGGNEYEMSGQLVLRQTDPLSIEVSLNDIKVVNSTGTKLAAVSASGTLRKAYATDDAPKTQSGETLPFLLVKMFEQALERLVEVPFSIPDFMKKFGLVRSLDEANVALQGTKAYFPVRLRDRVGPQAALTPIAYEDNYTIQSRRVKVRLGGISLRMQRLERRLNSEPQKYALKLDFREAAVEPSTYRSYLTWKDDYTMILQTGFLDTSPPMTEKGASIGQAVEGIFSKILEPLRLGQLERALEGKLDLTREGLPKPHNSESMPEGLRIRRIWEALSRRPPVKAHCIARAVQLLNVAAIRGVFSPADFTQACRTRFAFMDNGSLPTTGQSIMTSVGIRALAQLYQDLVTGAAPGLVKSPDFQAFLGRFQKVYAAAEALEPTEIRVPRPAVCTEPVRLQVQKQTAKQLRAAARELLSIQERHLRSVMAILFRLFDEKQVRAGKIVMHSRLLSEGMEYLNGVTKEARDLLMDYYTDCEDTYLKGVALLKGAKTGQFGPPDGTRPPITRPQEEEN